MTAYITAKHPTRGRLYAAFDPTVHHISGRVEESRFAARLAPFETVEEAEAALIAAGAMLRSARA